ncbi:MAG: hypothetical protein E6G10_19080 [Actinobacteria bacterium]|nr:MAG: hypothetical protein E6G10_19080 [Actinomycetota bacterium]
MLNGQDIVVLLKLAGQDEDWTVRSLEAALGIPRAGVHRSLQRLSAAGVYDLDRRRTNLSQAEEFLVHAVKYLFPPQMTGEARGTPTAWAASPLADELAPPSDLPPCGPTRRVASAASPSRRFIPLCPSWPAAIPSSPNASPSLTRSAWATRASADSQPGSSASDSRGQLRQREYRPAGARGRGTRPAARRGRRRPTSDAASQARAEAIVMPRLRALMA